MIRGLSEIVLIGDFLDPADDVMARISPLAKRGLRGHVIAIADPAEVDFPYAGRTEFTDPETGEKLTAGRAETLRDDYRAAYPANRDALGEALRHLGWTYIRHATDRLASEALVSAHIYLSGAYRGRAALMGSLRLCQSDPAGGTCRPSGHLVAAAHHAATPGERSLSAAQILGQILHREETPAHQPLVADRIAHGPGSADHFRARRTGHEPRAKVAGRRRAPWRWSSTMTGPSAPDWDARMKTARELIQEASVNDIPVSLTLTADPQQDPVPASADTAMKRLNAAAPRPLQANRASRLPPA